MEKMESLKSLGLDNPGRVCWNLPTPALYQEAIRRYEGMLSHLGPLIVRTGEHTGRLPKDSVPTTRPNTL
jgi:phosphoenolpyruvate carboxykinase (ATP)